MRTLKDLSAAQLERIINIKQQIEDLESELDQIASGGGKRRGRPPGAGKILGRPPGNPKRRKMSAAGRKAIAEAAKKRWAAYRGEKPAKPEKPMKKRRTMSAAGRAKIAAAAKARWAKAKAAGKTTL